MTGDARKTLLAGLEGLGYAVDDRAERLVRYLDEIELWNAKLGLVAAAGRELVVRHVLDSLAGAATLVAAGILRENARVADAGSGAGLPGIPMAVMHPDASVDLVERSGRRAGFLRNAVAAVRAGNARVVNTDVARYDGPVELVVHRAFLPLTADLVATLSRTLVPGGAICAYKGRRDAVDEELGGLEREREERGHGPVTVSVLPVDVPFLAEERHLVVVDATGG
ncbi:MAG: 16S rRNA (guanine(527)-N(7))-methyltransferase RsmG [Spirochaetota bacterium]